MAPKPSASFGVALGDVKLSKSQAQALNRAIQGAALAELARFDLGSGVRVRFPKEWRGIWIDKAPIGGGGIPGTPFG